MGAPIALDASGRPVSVAAGSLTPLDAIGRPIPGASYDATARVAVGANGAPLPRDWSGDCVQHFHTRGLR